MTWASVGSVRTGGIAQVGTANIHTGCELTGSIAEQNDQWDDDKRNFRARGDRERTVPVSDLPSEPYVRDTNIRPMHHWYD